MTAWVVVLGTYMTALVVVLGTTGIAFLLIRTVVEACRPEASELKRFIAGLILFGAFVAVVYWLARTMGRPF